MKIVVIALTMMVALSSYAQDYKAIAWGALKELNTLEKPTGNTRYHFKYKVRTVYKNNSQQPVAASFETIVAKDRILIQSDKSAYYQDEKNAFAVIKEEQKIIWNDSPLDSWGKQDFSGFTKVKKTFFDTGTYTRIQRKNEPEGIMLLKMVPDLAVRKKSTTDYLLIEVNTITNKVTRMLIHYNEASEQKLTEYIYEKADLNSNIPIASKAKDYLLTSQNKLKAAYQNYEVIDLRRKK